MGIKILQGKDFSGTPSDSTSMLLNKAAVEAMGLKNPVGMQMRYGRTFTVIGVTDNVIMGSPFEPVDPMMIFYDPYGANSDKHTTKKCSYSLKKHWDLLKRSLKNIILLYPFEYKFVDQEFRKEIYH